MEGSDARTVHTAEALALERDILHSFVRVMVSAIDMRSPYNANHTKSMVRYAEGFFRWLEEEYFATVQPRGLRACLRTQDHNGIKDSHGSGAQAACESAEDADRGALECEKRRDPGATFPSMTEQLQCDREEGRETGRDGSDPWGPEDLRALLGERSPFLMSVWLHDIGKLITPLSIMDKATKLGQREPAIRHRLEVADLCERLWAAEHPDALAETEAKRARLREAGELIFRANTMGELDDATILQLREIADLPCRRADGETEPLLDGDELDAITIPHGTLTDKERQIMNGHVVYTARMLSEMKFDGIYSQVPAWAGAHHELLDGSGYPDGRGSDTLPLEVRLLTILDIYDALTAEDRPYKPPMPPAEAFSVLEGMAESGKIDAKLLDLFRESGAWRRRDVKKG